MSILKEINDPEVTRVLQQAELRSDSDLRSLTREDLNELFPGSEKFKLRRKIFATIDKHNSQKLKKPVNELLKELEGFIPHDSLRAALTDNGVLVDYLHILKDMKKQMNDVQTFLDAHISLLEDVRRPQPELKSVKGQHGSGFVVPDDSLMVKKKSQTEKRAQGNRPKNSVISSSMYNEVIYKPVVCGKTFNADAQMMTSVRTQVQDWFQIIEWNPDHFPDHQVNIVFCPVSSRAGTDAEEALKSVTDDKPVILVLMYHTHQPKPVQRTFADLKNVVLCVSVFYHDTIHGLVKCNENDVAVSQIQTKLREYMISKATCVNTYDETVESDETEGVGGDDAMSSTTHGGNRDLDATAHYVMDRENTGLLSRLLSPWSQGKTS